MPEDIDDASALARLSLHCTELKPLAQGKFLLHAVVVQGNRQKVFMFGLKDGKSN